jgi:hypothetical protein
MSLSVGRSLVFSRKMIVPFMMFLVVSSQCCDSPGHLKLSSWAEEFEKRQGQIRCEQRVENNALRRQGEFVKERHYAYEAP